MSKMSETIIEIQELIEHSGMSFAQIAEHLNVPIRWVIQANYMLEEYYYEKEI